MEATESTEYESHPQSSPHVKVVKHEARVSFLSLLSTFTELCGFQLVSVFDKFFFLFEAENLLFLSVFQHFKLLSP